MLISKKPLWQKPLLFTISSLTFITILGCNSASKPIAEMSAAETMVNAVDNEETTQYAPIIIDRARQKLKYAKAALAKRNNKEAKRQAEEAQADAELAQAISSKSQTENAVKKLENSIQMLRDEIMRARNR
jgi:hypothetical protein